MQVNVLEWLMRTADNYSDKVALVDSESVVTYSEYKQKAVAIARKIIEKGLGVQQPVVVYMEKSAKVLVSFAAVAASRNFYSPIDVDMPTSRAQKIIEILSPGLVITTAELKDRFKQLGYIGDFIVYEDVYPTSDDMNIVESVLHSIIDTDLLYVLFTSGSTGVPKGVAIRHKSVIDYVDWVVEEFGINESDSFGNQAPFYFDNSILDIYSSMKTGATLHVIDKKLFFSPVSLLKYLKENNITTIFWVPSALIKVAKLHALKNVDLSDTLRRVLFCGEVMPNKQLNYWRSYLPDVLYSNLYGPTEITDACTYYTIDREFTDEEPLPIGKPMRNTEILVLDENNCLILPSEKDRIGELCVKGTSLAVGYFRNPEKTKDAFVQNPLNLDYEEKIYRTGDFVTYNEYEELMYVGRKDYQIKHMGHRIELGEIETAVSSLEGFSRCCCIYDDKRSRIVLVLESGDTITKEEINSQLAKMVPEYMLPGKVFTVSEMPLNENGKINRKHLKEQLL